MSVTRRKSPPPSPPEEVNCCPFVEEHLLPNFSSKTWFHRQIFFCPKGSVLLPRPPEEVPGDPPTVRAGWHVVRRFSSLCAISLPHAYTRRSIDHHQQNLLSSPLPKLRNTLCVQERPVGPRLVCGPFPLSQTDLHPPAPPPRDHVRDRPYGHTPRWSPDRDSDRNHRPRLSPGCRSSVQGPSIPRRRSENGKRGQSTGDVKVRKRGMDRGSRTSPGVRPSHTGGTARPCGMCPPRRPRTLRPCTHSVPTVLTSRRTPRGQLGSRSGFTPRIVIRAPQKPESRKHPSTPPRVPPTETPPVTRREKGTLDIYPSP